MKIAIITRPDNKSPRILANNLKIQLEQAGVFVKIIYNAALLTRMVSYRRSGLNFQFWLRRKIYKYIPDMLLLNRLKKFDAVVMSECIPNAFWENLYNVEKFKKKIQRPVFLYEVYHPDNTPTRNAELHWDSDTVKERFDGYFYVSPVTEVRKYFPVNGYQVGLQSNDWNLTPKPKRDFTAIVDFAQPGYEQQRLLQIKALKRAGIQYHCLEGNYSIDAIRSIYQQASLFFLQFPEAFGLPILECLNCGVQIFTPDAAWPMSWRLDEKPGVHQPGILPACFTVYKNYEDLVNKLVSFKENFDAVNTPLQVFENFLQNYPSFYYGNTKELNRCIDHIEGVA